MNHAPTAERWEIIEEIFHAAIAESISDHRYAKAKELAGNDASLLQEVWSLIQASDSAGSFLEDRSDLNEEVFEQLLDRLQLEELQSLSLSKHTGAGLSVLSHCSFNGSTLSASTQPELVPSLKRTHSQDKKLRDLERLLQQLRPEFEILDLAGQGGAGVVFHVHDQRLERNVAVKILHRRKDSEFNEACLKRESIAAIIQSDYVVRVYEVAPRDSSLRYLVMEWIKGLSLRKWLQEFGSLPYRDAARFVNQVAMGVQAAHQLGLVHGDIKPANILLDPIYVDATPAQAKAFRAKVTDFGLARSAQQETGDEKRFEGTPAYSDPQRLLENQPSTFESDVWSLGATLYHCLVGSPPYQGSSIQIIRNMQLSDPTAPRQFDAAIPKDLESICIKALSRQPESRYRNAGEMSDDLERYLAGQPVLARPVGPLHRLSRWGQRNPIVAILAIVTTTLFTIVLCGSLIATWQLKRQNSEILRQTQVATLARLEQSVSGDAAGLSMLLNSREFFGQQEKDFLKQMVVAEQNRLSQTQINAAVLLAITGQPHCELLVKAILQGVASPAQCQNLIEALSNSPTDSIAEIRRTVDSTVDPAMKARLAIVAAGLDDFSLINDLCKPAPNPSERTAIVHGLPNFHPSTSILLKLIEQEQSHDVCSAICSGLSLIDAREFAEDDLDALGQRLNILQSTTEAGATYSAARLALRNWNKIPVARIDKPIHGQRIKTTAGGIALVMIPPGTTRVGRLDPFVLNDDNAPHRVEITKPFFLATTEVTVEQFGLFLASVDRTREPIPHAADTISPDPIVSPTQAHPMQKVSWRDAALFCNWLSQLEGLQPRYRFDSRLDDDNPETDEAISIDVSANGYRLPTDAQWEHACRAGTTTDYFFGDDSKLLPFYGAFSNARKSSSTPVAELLPNPYGLVGMNGNVWE